MMKLLLIAFIAINASVLVNSQGESCTTHDNFAGVCTELPLCATLIQLYRTNPSQNTVNILLANQKNCGNRKVGKNPLMCCSDGVPQTTRPPPTSAPSGNACTTPDSIRGYCVGVKQCNSVLQTFIQRQKDPQYIQYIKQSNANCNYASQAVCCPLDAPTPIETPPTPVEETPIAQPNSRTESRLFVPSEGCGVSKVPHNRVVGGVPAKKGGWPWMALIGYKSSIGEISFKCGGSIISNRHILTAAHCIRRDLSSVRLGEHDLSTDSEAQHVDLPVASIIQYPNYDKKDGTGDLAILVLDGDIQFSQSISPICIPINEPEKSKNFVRLNPFVAGWGRTTEGGKSANVLQELQLPVLPNEQCKADYAAVGKVISDKQFDDAVLCAGYREGGKDSCQGDSGGPLMFPFQIDGDFFYYQIGIVSYGIGCARSQIPGVYTKVSKFGDWIKNTVETT